MRKLDPAVLEKTTARLREVADILKQEFFGMDEIIDLVIFNIRPWYTFPQLILRPVIINLWGLTGVGKTDFVRRLVHLLDFADRFVEVQMDGISSGGDYERTICGMLSRSSIEESKPGVLLLDEFQRYRTIDQLGNDVKVERYQDVWMLLSDGKFPADSSLFRELEMTLANALWGQESMVEVKKETPDGKEDKRPRLLYPYEAARFKKLLKLPNSVVEIMGMGTDQLMGLVHDAVADRKNSQIDYTKLLIFVSGNLDEAYHMADATEDCDTDADVFHKQTRRLSVVQIKKSLTTRFKPEQVARFGNNHIIYPSLSKATYQKLIKRTCKGYIDTLHDVTGIEFSLDPPSLDVIYDNSVYPTQGTRPVFTSVYKIFSCAFSEATLWALQRDLKAVELSIDRGRSLLIARSLETDERHETKVDLDIEGIRKKASEDYKTVVAVHEAAHALVYAVLFKTAPQEVKINASSFAAGYMIPDEDLVRQVESRRNVQDQISVLFAGRCGETLVFGPDLITLGAEHDIAKATELAVKYVRASALANVAGLQQPWEFGRPMKTMIPSESADEAVEALLSEHRERATQLLVEHKPLFVRLVSALLMGQTLTKQQFTDMFPELHLTIEPIYADLWQKFKG